MEGESWMRNHAREDHGDIWVDSGSNSGGHLGATERHLGGWRQLTHTPWRHLGAIVDACGETLESSGTSWKLYCAAGAPDVSQEASWKENVANSCCFTVESGANDRSGSEGAM